MLRFALIIRGFLWKPTEASTSPVSPSQPLPLQPREAVRESQGLACDTGIFRETSLKMPVFSPEFGYPAGFL